MVLLLYVLHTLSNCHEFTLTVEAYKAITQNIVQKTEKGTPGILFFLYVVVPCFINRWMDSLGVAAKEGIGVFIRQTFYGGYYGLIDSNLMPNPVGLD